MTAGHQDDEEQQQLVRNESNESISQSSSSKKDHHKYVSTEKTSIFIAQTKNYGTVTTEFTGPNERLTYSWHNLDVFGEVHQPGPNIGRMLKRIKGFICGEKRVPTPRKHLLKCVSGIAYPGELLAVMGSSGAGKTTLLNALAFRSPSGVQVSPSAIRMLNSYPVQAEEMQARCAYVQQDDLFIGSLTAREHLIFQAMLRMPRNLLYKRKIERVDQVIQELSLGKCQNTMIGIPGRIKGLSGGERKRLAFASEALTDPPLLLCDEPTSGLDSFMANSVLQVLKGLSQKGKTIILTIHQPSSELYELFDRILLMAEGRVAFLGTPNEAAEFFSQLGARCPLNYNPADFYVQVLAIVPGKEIESRERIQKICDSFAVGSVYKEMEQEFRKQTESSTLIPVDDDAFREYKASWLMQLRAILWRAWLTVLKEPLLVKVRLIQTTELFEFLSNTMVAVLIGLIFLNQDLTQDGVMNINGAIFLFLTNMTFQNVFAVINVFSSELPVFLRETRSRLYRCDTYFLGKTLAELPLFLAVPFVFTSIAYPLIGLRSGFNHYIIALSIVTLIANVSTSFGYLISCASSSTSMALSIGSPVIIPFLLFGGFFLNSGSVPIYFTWLAYLSWFRYGNEGLLINQWADVQPGEIKCTRSNATCPNSGHVILETLNFNESDLVYDFLGLILLIIGFRLFAYFALLCKTKIKE